jgi:hypothetical protein
MLHDRTRRAMVNHRGFLTSANLEDLFADIRRYHSLFYTFRPGEIGERCAAVMASPEEHAARAAEFADLYHNTFRVRDFVRTLEQLARLPGMARQIAAADPA